MTTALATAARSTPPPVRECPPEHKHGATGTCYVLHRCRCTDCRYSNSARERRRVRLKAYGRYDHGLIDAEPARQHILTLKRSGMGTKTIGRLAGIRQTGISDLVYGRRRDGKEELEQIRRIPREKAEKILAVQLDPALLHPRHRVPAMPYVRRIRALIAMGWSQAGLARELHVDLQTIHKALRRADTAKYPGRLTMRAGSAVAIAASYDRLSMTPPPEGTHPERVAAARSRNRAAAAGWPLPFDWAAVDDDFTRNIRRSA